MCIPVKYIKFTLYRLSRFYTHTHTHTHTHAHTTYTCATTINEKGGNEFEEKEQEEVCGKNWRKIEKGK